MNAFITSTRQTLLPLYAELFNLIFDTSEVPEIWPTGLVKPIYNGKNDRSQPESYKPITLLSCLGKLFTSILSDRLNTFPDEVHLLAKPKQVLEKAIVQPIIFTSLIFSANTLLPIRKKNIM